MFCYIAEVWHQSEKANSNNVWIYTPVDLILNTTQLMHLYMALEALSVAYSLYILLSKTWYFTKSSSGTLGSSRRPVVGSGLVVHRPHLEKDWVKGTVNPKIRIQPWYSNVQSK